MSKTCCIEVDVGLGVSQQHRSFDRVLLIMQECCGIARGVSFQKLDNNRIYNSFFSRVGREKKLHIDAKTCPWPNTKPATRHLRRARGWRAVHESVHNVSLEFWWVCIDR